MTYTPRFIIYLAVINYLSEEQIEKLKKELGESNLKQDRRFLTIIKKHFDIEQLKDKPFIWQDIWLYNYLHYEIKSRLPRKGLIAKYEREIIIPQKKFSDELKELMHSLNIS
jgi:hypothetical protein